MRKKNKLDSEKIEITGTIEPEKEWELGYSCDIALEKLMVLYALCDEFRDDCQMVH